MQLAATGDRTGERLAAGRFIVHYHSWNSTEHMSNRDFSAFVTSTEWDITHGNIGVK
jgi:hypothetical protein